MKKTLIAVLTILTHQWIWTCTGKERKRNYHIR